MDKEKNFSEKVLGLENIYGSKVTKTVQEVGKLLNGLSIEEGDRVLYLVRERFREFGILKMDD